jgi:CO/xanthine dehydrogenase FAD-binding subunit
MLLNLKTIHKPATIDEALTLLQQPGTYPLYGGVTLQRRVSPDVLAVVDLCNLDLDYVRDSESSVRLGSMLTIEQARQACLERGPEHQRLIAIANVLADEMPETLRNTMCVGDLLTERNPQSLAMTMFLALSGILKRVDVDMHITMAAWLTADISALRYLISQIRFTRGSSRAAVAYEKVARTPADAPIVAAVACVEPGQDGLIPHYTTLALCGVALTPVPQPEVTRVLDETGDVDKALDYLKLDPPDDYLGSREYRTEMAKILSRRVLLEAIEKSKG